MDNLPLGFPDLHIGKEYILDGEVVKLINWDFRCVVVLLNNGMVKIITDKNVLKNK